MVVFAEKGLEFGTWIGTRDFCEEDWLLLEHLVESCNQVEAHFGVLKHQIRVMVIVMDIADCHRMQSPGR